MDAKRTPQGGTIASEFTAFTWNLRTEEGRTAIAAMLATRLEDVAPSDFALSAEASESAGVVEAWFGFETRVGRCTGQVRLKEGRAWTMFTALDELKGHKERLRERRPVGAEHGVYPGRLSWAERRSQNRDDLGFRKQPDVVIVGGGQAGLGPAPGCATLMCPP